jgi:hypothetical protein
MGKVAGIPGVGTYLAGALEGADPNSVAVIRQKLSKSRVSYEQAKGGVRLVASPQMFERMKEVTGLDVNQNAAGQLSGIDNQLRALIAAKGELEAANPMGARVISGQPLPSIRNAVQVPASVTGRETPQFSGDRSSSGISITNSSGGNSRLEQLRAEQARRRGMK